MTKKILYIDMDGVMVDLESAAKKAGIHVGKYSDLNGVFKDLQTIEKAVETIQRLSYHFDCFIATSAPWDNISSASDKRLWIEKIFGSEKGSIFWKKMVITHRKGLLYGDYLIDDRPNNGAKDFKGKWIQFGSKDFPDWRSVELYLMEELQS